MTDAPPRSGRGWLGSHPRAVDALLVLAVGLGSLVLLATYRGIGGYDDAVGYRRADLAGVALVLALALPLWWRRSRPLAATLVVAAAAFGLGILLYAAPLAGVAMLLAGYAAGAYAGFRKGLAALAAISASSSAYLVWLGVQHPEVPGTDPASILVNVFAFVAAWALGRGVRNRRAYTEELVHRAERLERTRAAEVRAALAEERARIARELHDVVAHHVSVMTVQAAAARRTLERDPVRSSEAMAAVEHTGRDALAEMRRIVGVLRGPEPDPPRPGMAPQPGLQDLPALVGQLRDAGLEVDTRVEGERPPVPPGVDLTAFRVVQEALTNTLKHAGPTRAEVSVRYLPGELSVRVVDDGRGLAAGLDGHRPGHGLLGMRERVALYGGTLHVGPRDGGGFDVRAHIPILQASR
ncbi:MAG TPA: sensor histidine kinase [Jiangellales bacterium]|nr:sensor histidine kinase [Jiangellales bacterium]